MGRTGEPRRIVGRAPPHAHLADDYQELFRELLAKFRSRGVSAEESKDLAQETVLRTLVHLRRHDQTSEDLGPLVRTIARNLFIERLRRGEPRVAPLTESLVDDRPQPAEEVLVAERRAEVREAVASLSPRHRRVVQLWMEGQTPASIARELGIKRNAADALLHRARRRLASKLEGSALGLIFGVFGWVRSTARRAVVFFGGADPSGTVGQAAGGLVTIGVAAAIVSIAAGGIGSPARTNGADTGRATVALSAQTRPASVSTEQAPSRGKVTTQPSAPVDERGVGVGARQPNPVASGGPDWEVESGQQRDENRRGIAGPALDAVDEVACQGGAPVCSETSE